MSYFETLERWQELQEIIPRLQAEERALREGLFRGTFPDPVEGTNKVELPDGRILKAVHKIYRTVQEDVLAKLNLSPKQRKDLFRVKHELRISPYRNLDPDTRKLVDKAIVAKPGLPTLEIIEQETVEEVAP